jgi:hypothetical protein
MEQEQLWKLLEAIQSQIRSFDTKAQVALGIDGLLAGLLGTQIVKSTEFGAAGMHIRFCIALFLSVISLTSIAYSFFWGLRTVHPQLHLRQPKSHFFFCHLVELYGHNYNKAAEALKALSGDAVEQEIGTQVMAISVICDVKAKRCRRALSYSGVALAFYLATLLPFSSMAYEANRNVLIHTTSIKTAPSR